jgi:prolyl oligopeptidase
MKTVSKFSILMLGILMQQEANAQLPYPQTRKTDLVEDYHGTKVADPYRWLENDTSEETKAWVKAENEVTNAYLSKIPYRNKIRDRINELLNYPRYSAPFSAGKYYLYSKNDGLQNQSVYYRQDGLSGEPVEFLDPNKLAADGTASAGFAGISTDKKYIAYTLSRAGSDWSEMRIREIATGKD